MKGLSICFSYMPYNFWDAVDFDMLTYYVRDMYALRDSSKLLYFTYCQFNVVDFKTGSAAQSSVSTSFFSL